MNTSFSSFYGMVKQTLIWLIWNPWLLHSKQFITKFMLSYEDSGNRKEQSDQIKLMIPIRRALVHELFKKLKEWAFFPKFTQITVSIHWKKNANSIDYQSPDTVCCIEKEIIDKIDRTTKSCSGLPPKIQIN